MLYLRLYSGMEKSTDFRINIDLRSNTPMSENGQHNLISLNLFLCKKGNNIYFKELLETKWENIWNILILWYFLISLLWTY